MICFYVHLVRLSYSARILGVLNFEMLSHFYFHETMMKSLAKAGHHITMVSPYELQHPHENITVINSKAQKLKNDDSAMKSFARANLPFLPAMVAFLEIVDQDCRNVISLLQEKVSTYPLHILPLICNILIPPVSYRLNSSSIL